MSDKIIMVAAVLAICLVIGLAGCAPVEKPEPIVRTVEVKVPVITHRTAPASLKRTPIQKWRWISPLSETATSCLSSDGEKAIKGYMIDRETRLDVYEKSGF